MTHVGSAGAGKKAEGASNYATAAKASPFHVRACCRLL